MVNNNEETQLSNEEWEKKYDVIIEVIREDYLISLGRINNVDEKANKYLVIISIFFAGVFTVCSSSLSDKLNFNNIGNTLSFSNLFSIAYVITSIIGFYYGIKILVALLNCLKLTETKRMPNLLQMVEKTGNNGSVHLKNEIISLYQEITDFIAIQTSKKQENLYVVSESITNFILWIFLSLLILFILKFIG